ncbi:MAG: SelA-like pyridoxal phosphate-dependent enzyme [Candidatus Bathyarchaeia archaeon]
MDIYRRFGVKRVINAVGTVTFLGGSAPPKEVLEAMDEAARGYVNMDELQRRASELIAEATGAEAGHVTAGAAAGIVLATAACIAGKDPEKIAMLPNSEGLRNEVVLPKMCSSSFNQCFMLGGGRLVFAGTEDSCTEQDLEEAVGERTAAIGLLFYTGTERGYPLLERAVRVGRRRRVPVIVDAAAELPPEENLRGIVAAGADLVIFSGGKAIQGPNDTGILCGRRDLVEAAAAQASPHAGVGRPMKVSKEQVIGLLTALRLFTAKDFRAERETWEAKVQSLIQLLSGIPHVAVRRVFPDVSKEYHAQCWPRASVTLDEGALGVTAREVAEQLREGDPAIYVMLERNSLVVNPHLLQDGEEKLIAERLRAILQKPASGGVVA